MKKKQPKQRRPKIRRRKAKTQNLSGQSSKLITKLRKAMELINPSSIYKLDDGQTAQELTGREIIRAAMAMEEAIAAKDRGDFEAQAIAVQKLLNSGLDS